MASVPIETSARHIHITEADWVALFGDATIVSDHAISQPGQFVATQRVALRSPKAEYKNVGVVGPFRSYTQVELAPSEARHLGLTPPVTDSGKLDKAVAITIVGPKGELVRDAAIIQERHIHCPPDAAKKHGLKDGQIVSVVVPGPRGARLDNVIVRVNKDYAFRLHLDLDEGNACGVKPGMTAEIV